MPRRLCPLWHPATHVSQLDKRWKLTTVDTTSKAREFYDKHFSGIFPPGLGLFTIGRYMSLKRSVMVHAIDTFEKENPGREVDTYFIASTSYSRYRASFDKDLAHVPRFRMVVLPEE